MFPPAATERVSAGTEYPDSHTELRTRLLSPPPFLPRAEQGTVSATGFTHLLPQSRTRTAANCALMAPERGQCACPLTH